MAAGLRILARRARSAAEIERRLLERGFSRAAVRSGLGRLRKLGYINDGKLAAERSELLQQRGYGARRIRYDLEHRGIVQDIVAAVLPGMETECLIARRVLELRFRKGPSRDRRERGRVARHLAGRGFLPETVEWVLGTWDDS